MSPTVFWECGYRFFFFSREESRKHVHVHCPEGEAKFWVEPDVTLACSVGLTKKQLGLIQKIVKDHRDEIAKSWNDHFRD